MILDLAPDISAILFFLAGGFLACIGFRLCDWCINTFVDALLDWWENRKD